MPQLSRKNKQREFWLSSPYSHPLLVPPTHTSYSHPLLAPPTCTPFSHPLLAPPPYTPYSHPLLAPATRTRYSHPILAPPTRTIYSHLLLTPATRTPYSYLLLAPPTHTPLLSSYSQFNLHFAAAAMQWSGSGLRPVTVNAGTFFNINPDEGSSTCVICRIKYIDRWEWTVVSGRVFRYFCHRTSLRRAPQNIRFFGLLASVVGYFQNLFPATKASYRVGCSE